MPSRKASVLVVDDDVHILHMMQHTLELEGYRVLKANNGATAIDVFDETTPDLVLLDITMPGMDGFQLLALIRQRSNVPIIMLTGRTEVNTARDALTLGADDYVRKPFRTFELIARVRAKLRRVKQGARNTD